MELTNVVAARCTPSGNCFYTRTCKVDAASSVWKTLTKSQYAAARMQDVSNSSCDGASPFMDSTVPEDVLLQGTRALLDNESKAAIELMVSTSRLSDTYRFMVWKALFDVLLLRKGVSVRTMISACCLLKLRKRHDELLKKHQRLQATGRSAEDSVTSLDELDEVLALACHVVACLPTSSIVLQALLEPLHGHVPHDVNDMNSKAAGTLRHVHQAVSNGDTGRVNSVVSTEDNVVLVSSQLQQWIVDAKYTTCVASDVMPVTYLKERAAQVLQSELESCKDQELSAKRRKKPRVKHAKQGQQQSLKTCSNPSTRPCVHPSDLCRLYGQALVYQQEYERYIDRSATDAALSATTEDPVRWKPFPYFLRYVGNLLYALTSSKMSRLYALNPRQLGDVGFAGKSRNRTKESIVISHKDRVGPSACYGSLIEQLGNTAEALHQHVSGLGKESTDSEAHIILRICKAVLDAVYVPVRGTRAWDQDIASLPWPLLCMVAKGHPVTVFCTCIMQAISFHKYASHAMFSLMFVQQVMYMRACSGGLLSVGDLDQRHEYIRSQVCFNDLLAVCSNTKRTRIQALLNEFLPLRGSLEPSIVLDPSIKYSAVRPLLIPHLIRHLTNHTEHTGAVVDVSRDVLLMKGRFEEAGETGLSWWELLNARACFVRKIMLIDMHEKDLELRTANLCHEMLLRVWILNFQEALFMGRKLHISMEPCEGADPSLASRSAFMAVGSSSSRLHTYRSRYVAKQRRASVSKRPGASTRDGHITHIEEDFKKLDTMLFRNLQGKAP